MGYSKFKFVSSVAFVFVVPFASSAPAQSKCDAGKLKEYGKKVACLAKVESTAAKKGEAADAGKEAKCIDKFTEKCGKAEEKGDCTSNVLDCAALATEAEVCSATATDTCAPLGGVKVGGACWFLSPSGDDCDSTCVAAGLAYDSATDTYAGGNGTDMQCEEVLDALGAPADPLNSVDCGFGVGCILSGGTNRVRCTEPTTSDGSAVNLERACACQ